MGLLKASECVLLVVDIQERLLSAMAAEDAARLVRDAGILMQASARLLVPVVISEQYPKGLGHTVAALMDIPTHARVMEKTAFGCLGDEAIKAFLAGLGKKQVLVCGMEAHVCVNQTVHQLLAEGYEVHVVQDAVISRNRRDYKTALQRMRHAGAIASTTEMAVFELLCDAKHEAFKEVQALIK